MLRMCSAIYTLLIGMHGHFTYFSWWSWWRWSQEAISIYLRREFLYTFFVLSVVKLSIFGSRDFNCFGPTAVRNKVVHTLWILLDVILTHFCSRAINLSHITVMMCSLCSTSLVFFSAFSNEFSQPHNLFSFCVRWMLSAALGAENQASAGKKPTFLLHKFDFIQLHIIG